MWMQRISSVCIGVFNLYIVSLVLFFLKLSIQIYLFNSMQAPLIVRIRMNKLRNNLEFHVNYAI